MTTPNSNCNAHVIGVAGNIVSIEAEGPIMKNEVAYVQVGDDRLKSEVLRVFGRTADMQVFEDTQGVSVGDRVELTKQMLSASLGPGLLGTVFDGLQNPLHQLAERDGFFLHRGSTFEALSNQVTWEFHPRCSIGDVVKAGDVIGSVPERRVTHKIMVPFGEAESLKIEWIAKGNYRVDETIARRSRSSRTRA